MGRKKETSKVEKPKGAGHRKFWMLHSKDYSK